MDEVPRALATKRLGELCGKSAPPIILAHLAGQEKGGKCGLLKLDRPTKWLAENSTLEHKHRQENPQTRAL